MWDYRYDNEGNLAGKTHLVTGETWDYGYDHLNRMLSAEHRAADGTLLLRATYRYDVFGHRIEQAVFDASTGETMVTRFAYNGDELYAVLDGNNQLIKRYVSLDGPDSAFARVGADGTVVFLLRDRLGSVRDVVSDQGAVLDHVDYDAWGNVSHETNPAAGDQIKYAGYWQDTAVGLYQVFHRWYDPTIGRWISKDPMSFEAGDSDLYRYVGNCPTNEVDPSGFWAAPPPRALTGQSVITLQRWRSLSAQKRTQWLADIAQTGRALAPSEVGVLLQIRSRETQRGRPSTVVGDFLAAQLPMQLAARQATQPFPLARMGSYIGYLGPISSGIQNVYIRGLIKQLGSDVWKTREAAQNKLAAVMPLAYSQILEARRNNPDLEIRTRARRLLRASAIYYWDQELTVNLSVLQAIMSIPAKERAEFMDEIRDNPNLYPGQLVAIANNLRAFISFLSMSWLR